jgi:hypothetical protein
MKNERSAAEESKNFDNKDNPKFSTKKGTTKDMAIGKSSRSKTLSFLDANSVAAQ